MYGVCLSLAPCIYSLVQHLIMASKLSYLEKYYGASTNMTHTDDDDNDAIQKHQAKKKKKKKSKKVRKPRRWRIFRW